MQCLTRKHNDFKCTVERSCKPSLPKQCDDNPLYIPLMSVSHSKSARRSSFSNLSATAAPGLPYTAPSPGPPAEQLVPDFCTLRRGTAIRRSEVAVPYHATNGVISCNGETPDLGDCRNGNSMLHYTHNRYY